jgi:hypothetical protein
MALNRFRHKEKHSALKQQRAFSSRAQAESTADALPGHSDLDHCGSTGTISAADAPGADTHSTAALESRQTMMKSPESHPHGLFQRLIRGHFGLALTYWTLFLSASVVFFVFGSAAVAAEQWPRYLTGLGAMLAWTFLLLVGVQRGFRGEDPGKALGRVAMLFLALVLTNALATLSFV